LNRRDLLILGSTSIAWPLAAHAQQKATPVIGWLSALSPLTQRPSPGSVVAAFHEGLNQTGYVEGKNVAIEYRWAEGHQHQHRSELIQSLDPEGELGLSDSAGTW